MNTVRQDLRFKTQSYISCQHWIADYCHGRLCKDCSIFHKFRRKPFHFNNSSFFSFYINKLKAESIW